MRKLPPKGLIVSCYLEAMKGCERNFIASVAHLPQVVALRVEGLENIQFARMIAPEKYIIGLVKHRVEGVDLITPTADEGFDIIAEGADMAATGFFALWRNVDFPVMYDVATRTANLSRWQLGIDARTVVFSTTYMPKAFELVFEWRHTFPNAVINLEGGIETASEIQRGFGQGANYVTIGKAINDPPTIIKHLMEGVYAAGSA